MFSYRIIVYGNPLVILPDKKRKEKKNIKKNTYMFVISYYNS